MPVHIAAMGKKKAPLLNIDKANDVIQIAYMF